MTMVGIVRINKLYNTPAQPERPAQAGKPARPAQPARPGRFGVSRSTFHDNFVHHSDDDPYVSGTDDVKRLKLLHLAPNAAAAFEDEIAELEADLKRCRDKSFAERKQPQPIGKPTKAVRAARDRRNVKIRNPEARA
jgi:hypothetical protein